MSNIGVYKIHNVQPNASGESQKIKVKVKMTIHGTFKVSSASMYESVLETASEPMEVDNNEANAEEKQEAPANEEEGDANQKEEKKEKKKTVTTELPVQTIASGLKGEAVDNFHKQEVVSIVLLYSKHIH